MTFVQREYSLAATLVLAAAISGCSTTTPKLDASLGTAVRTVVVAQCIDPGAGRRESQTQLDGESANAAVKQYIRSFGSPPSTADAFTIGVSRAGSAVHP